MYSYLQHQQSVLGAIFLEPSCLDDVTQMLRVDDFDERHARIFQACIDVAEQKGIPDLVTVSKLVPDMSMYLDELVDFVPTASNVKYYAKGVADFGQRRRLGDILSGGLEKLRAGENPKAWIEQQISGMRNNNTGVKNITKVLSETWKDIENIAKNGKAQGYSTGISDLDKFGIFQDGDLIVVAGRPGMGKSVLGAQLLDNNGDVGSVIHTFEMSNSQLCKRLLASNGRVELSKIRDGKFNDSDYGKLTEATEKLSSKNVWFNDTSNSSIQDLRAKTRIMARKHGIKIVVVDYIQLCYDENVKNNREQEVSSITRNLKLMAKELNVCVVALAQLNRKLEERADKRPVMADLRESGAIEQDADVIIFTYRDTVYNRNAPQRDAELIVAKFRNGEPGYVKCLFFGEHQRFRDEHK